jgi:hypothetical protein
LVTNLADHDALKQCSDAHSRKSMLAPVRRYARLGITLPVIEKCLNHRSGSFAGIVGVYQRHSFADEKRNALEAWTRFVIALANDKSSDNVVALRA